MQIETKYNLGDKVWFINVCKAREGMVIGITHSCFFVDNMMRMRSITRYRIESKPDYPELEEENLFPTKEELIKSL